MELSLVKSFCHITFTRTHPYYWYLHLWTISLFRNTSLKSYWLSIQAIPGWLQLFRSSLIFHLHISLSLFAIPINYWFDLLLTIHWFRLIFGYFMAEAFLLLFSLGLSLLSFFQHLVLKYTFHALANLLPAPLFLNSSRIWEFDWFANIQFIIIQFVNFLNQLWFGMNLMNDVLVIQGNFILLLPPRPTFMNYFCFEVWDANEQEPVINYLSYCQQLKCAMTKWRNS